MANVSKMPASLTTDKSPEEIAWLQNIEKLGNQLSTDVSELGETYSTIVRQVNVIAGTTHTVLASDNGKLLVFTSGSAVTVTVPSGLGEGFQADIVQAGAGQVSLSASGVTITSEDSKLKLTKQGSAATLAAYSADSFILAGGLST